MLENWRRSHGPEFQRALNDLTQLVDDHCENETKLAIVDSLYFDRIEERISQIPEAYQNTYKWIYEAPPAGPSISWSDFDMWLRKDEDRPYWITGKPGAGKSTLVRYLFDNDRTRSKLTTWASGRRLLIAKYFFWSDGTTLQNSQSGLLQSLLHDLLTQAPELVRHTVPRRWRICRLNRAISAAWPNNELLEALKALFEAALDNFRICIFIDGLDEFRGNNSEQEALIKLVQEISALPNVKVCISSRPWNIFEDAFAACPRLILQRLTGKDLQIYVNGKLSENPLFQKLQQSHKEDSAKIVRQIIQKAEGVFLWVFLAVRMISDGLRDGDTTQELLQHINEIPSDLEKFYEKIFSTIEPRHRGEASDMITLLISNYSLFSMMCMSFLREAPGFWEHIPFEAVDEDTIRRRGEETRRRINSRCKGMLEVRLMEKEALFTGERVVFLHRTLMEFFDEGPGNGLLQKFSEEHLTANFFLCESFLAQIKMARSENQFDILDLLRSFYFEAEEAYRDVPAATEKLIDEMDVLLRHHDAELQRLGSPRNFSGTSFSEIWNNWGAWNCSFLSIAVVQNNYDYVSQKLRNKPHLSRMPGGRPLLDFALFPTDMRRSCLAGKSDIARVILEQGADPNDLFDGQTIWHHFVEMVSTEVPRSELPTKYVAHIARDLIEFGASRWINMSSGQVDVAPMLEAAFDGPRGVELASLLRKIYPREPMSESGVPLLDVPVHTVKRKSKTLFRQIDRPAVRENLPYHGGWI